MIVVLAQTKGGVGKSTLAVNFAVERSRAGRVSTDVRNWTLFDIENWTPG